MCSQQLFAENEKIVLVSEGRCNISMGGSLRDQVEVYCFVHVLYVSQETFEYSNLQRHRFLSLYLAMNPSRAPEPLPII